MDLCCCDISIYSSDEVCLLRYVNTGVRASSRRFTFDLWSPSMTVDMLSADMIYRFRLQDVVDTNHCAAELRSIEPNSP